MIATVNGTRSWRRYRLVLARKEKLRLSSAALAALESHTRAHMLTTSGFFPCSIDREYLYGYAADGYRSPLWLYAAYNGHPALVHRHSGWVGGWGPQYHGRNGGRWTREGPGGR